MSAGPAAREEVVPLERRHLDFRDPRGRPALRRPGRTGNGFEATVSGRGLRYVALDVDLLELAQSPGGRAALRSPKGALRMARGLMPTVRRMLVDEWEAAASSGADAVVYHPKAIGGYHVAEAMGVPGFLALPVPALSPTRAFPVPVLPLPNLGGPLSAPPQKMSVERVLQDERQPL